MEDPGKCWEKVESMRVSINTVPEIIKKGSNLCEYRIMASSGSVQGKGRIRASVEKLSRRVSKNSRICVSIEKWQNPGEYREKVESVPV